jgi:hypothetical protein
MAKVEQYFLFDIRERLYCVGDGRFIRINECGISGYDKKHVASRIKQRDYPFNDGKWFFVKINEDGGIKIFQKDDEI